MGSRHELLKKHVMGRGGAHAAYSRFHPLLGTVSFVSCEDPHSLQTFESFERVYQALADGKFR